MQHQDQRQQGPGPDQDSEPGRKHRATRPVRDRHARQRPGPVISEEQGRGWKGGQDVRRQLARRHRKHGENGAEPAEEEERTGTCAGAPLVGPDPRPGRVPERRRQPSRPREQSREQDRDVVEGERAVLGREKPSEIALSQERPEQKIRIAQLHVDVPGSRRQDETRKRRGQKPRPDQVGASRGDQIHHKSERGEQGTDGALGERGEPECGPGQPRLQGAAVLDAAGGGEHPQRDEQGERHVGDRGSRQNDVLEAGREDNRRAERPHRVAADAPAERENRKKSSGRREDRSDSGARLRNAEEEKGGHDNPIEEDGLVEPGPSVEHRHVIGAAVHHLVRRDRVVGLIRIGQARPSEVNEIERKGQDQDEKNAAGDRSGNRRIHVSHPPAA